MKNKILDNLPTIFIALIILFSVTLTWNHAKAEEKSRQPSPVPEFNFWWSDVPSVCGLKPEVVKWLDKHEFTPVSMSFGREGGVTTGDIVYIVTMFVNDKFEQTTTVETPNGTEVCILYKTFNMKLNKNLGKGINL
tara:strand:+ start:76 stop:483 length:408 start_codon:yes stop_codon:yes gene_type:complete